MSQIQTCLKCPLRQFPCAGPCVCTVNGVSINAQTECPKGFFSAFDSSSIDEADIRAAKKFGRQPAGPKLWAELHARPWVYPGGDDTVWLLKDFTPRVPQFGCKCLDHWWEMLDRMPPNFSSRLLYFAATVDWHDAVNRRLGKPAMGLSAAMKLWQPKITS